MTKSAAARPMRRRKDVDPFPPFPRRFAPEGLNAGSKHDLDLLFMDLEDRPLPDPTALERWLQDWSELASIIAEEESRRYIAYGSNHVDLLSRSDVLDFFAKTRWTCKVCGWWERSLEKPARCFSCSSTDLQLERADPGH